MRDLEKFSPLLSAWRHSSPISDMSSITATVFQIEWDRKREGVEQVGPVLAAFRDRAEAHLKTI